MTPNFFFPLPNNQVSDPMGSVVEHDKKEEIILRTRSKTMVEK